ncbi:MAG: bifunctional 4'-phosphopantothenoylcysteine decarboxylase/phosphopantothenoylcysteine synthetase, partial [Candidatus Omnitrophica bacterium]|nr:bifunctional 4'-phosphopantothenoylcysteine decarboxylase/phosphopantothenoylcysteine synthetase [Candidatus Omnitrophota bacterium]
MPNPKVKQVVLGVCGSIAAYKAGDIIRRLQEHHCEVTVIMTKGAMQFITPLTLSALSGKKVYSDMFEDNAWSMAHIELALRADCVLIAPATGNVIGKLASGLADDSLTTFVMACQAPVFIAPAMNDQMYVNAIVKDNCAKLKKHGFKFIEPVKGKLACGTVGIGHLAEVEHIVNA